MLCVLIVLVSSSFFSVVCLSSKTCAHTHTHRLCVSRNRICTIWWNVCESPVCLPEIELHATHFLINFHGVNQMAARDCLEGRGSIGQMRTVLNASFFFYLCVIWIIIIHTFRVAKPTLSFLLINFLLSRPSESENRNHGSLRVLCFPFLSSYTIILLLFLSLPLSVVKKRRLLLSDIHVVVVVVEWISPVSEIYIYI